MASSTSLRESPSRPARTSIWTAISHGALLHVRLQWLGRQRHGGVARKDPAAGRLDTNLSVDAVSGMAGAADGLAALQDRTMAGKIVIYPSLSEVGLLSLAELSGAFPTVGGQACRRALVPRSGERAAEGGRLTTAQERGRQA